MLPHAGSQEYRAFVETAFRNKLATTNRAVNRSAVEERTRAVISKMQKHATSKVNLEQAIRKEQISKFELGKFLNFYFA